MKTKQTEEQAKLLTKKKNDADAAHLIQAHLNTVVNSFVGTYWWKDINGVYRGCNEKVVSLLGLNSVNDLIGKRDHELPWKKNANQLVENDNVVISGKENITYEENIIDAHGEEHIFLVTKAPLFDEKKEVIGTIGTSIDITDRKKAEARETLALLESIQAKEKACAEEQLRHAVTVLAGSIAHDLRIPLGILEMTGNSLKKYLPTLIEGYKQAKELELFIEGDKNIDARLGQHLSTLGEKIKETTRQMHEFIDTSLQSISKVLSGELAQEDLVVCSIWRCIHLTLQRYPFANKQRELIKWDQRDFKFKGNELLMIRILFNLLSNSLYQIDKNNGGEINISTEVKDDVNIINFKDTAGGVPPEAMEKLFTGYHTTKEKGTGVGLAFCKITMENFGGAMTCQSVYGKYIIFTLTFPKLSFGE